MKNRSDLITAVLQNLGIFAPGQVPRTSPEGNTRTRADLVGLILQNLGILRPGQVSRTPASSTKTHADLVKAVLENMQTFGAGQDPSVEDVDTTGFRIDQALEELKTRGVYTGSISGPYPDDLFVPLSATLSATLATPWGIAKLDGLDIETYRANAEKRLLQAQLARGNGNTLVEARLNGVLEELNTRGIYTGGITTTFPDTVYVPLAAAAAAMLASPLGIEKLDGVGLFDYRNDAEQRLYKTDLVRGRAFNQLSDRLEGILSELEAREVYMGVSFDEFDDAVFPSLVEAVSAIAAPSLGQQQIQGMNVDAYRMTAEIRLRRVNSAGNRNFIVQADYF